MKLILFEMNLEEERGSGKEPFVSLCLCEYYFDN